MRPDTMPSMIARRLSPALLLAALAVNLLVFALFVFFERPGLGIGNGFYVAIALAAIADGPLLGALAGVLSTLLYALGMLINPHVPVALIPTEATAIRLVVFVAVGSLLGYFASMNRRLWRASDELLAELSILAQRDFQTGLPNQRAFERTIGERLVAKKAFTLVVGDLDPGSAQTDVLDFVERLTALLPHGAEVTRVSEIQLAVILEEQEPTHARRLVAGLERLLDQGGSRATFGWAHYPRDGDNALGLYTAASERMYARKVARGTWSETRTATA